MLTSVMTRMSSCSHARLSVSADVEPEDDEVVVVSVVVGEVVVGVRVEDDVELEPEDASVPSPEDAYCPKHPVSALTKTLPRSVRLDSRLRMSPYAIRLRGGGQSSVPTWTRPENSLADPAGSLAASRALDTHRPRGVPA